MAEVMVGKTRLGLRLTKDAFNAAFNGSSLEDANRMEDRNQALLSFQSASCRPSSRSSSRAGSGQGKLKMEPPCGLGSYQMSPPCASTILRAMYRPSPMPGTEW